MRYECEVVIQEGRDEVVRLFEDLDVLKEWQEGFISLEIISGDPGKDGSVCRLKYEVKNRIVEMTETIQQNALPDSFHAVYEARGVWNGLKNTFEALSENETLWKMESEFICKGLLRLVVFFAPGTFKKQTILDMNRFKTFVEFQSKSE